MNKHKNLRKKKSKSIYGGRKTILVKNSSTPTNSTPVSPRSSLAKVIIAKQTLLKFWDKYYKKNNDVDHTELVENTLFIMEKKFSGEVTLSLSNSGKKRTISARGHYFFCIWVISN